MSAYRVLVTDSVSERGLAPLLGDPRFEVIREDDSGAPAFEAALAGAVGLIVRSATRVDAPLLAAAQELRVVGRAGVGVDNIDMAAATERGVAVLNAPAGNTVSAAELTMALLLTTVRRVPAADRSVRDKRWDRGRFKGSELRGKVLGLVGGGRIGGEVARRARAFGMRVVIYDPFLPEDRVRALDAEPAALDDLFRKADMVSLHVPLTQATRDLVDARRLGLMRKGSYLVNASRGGVVDECALAEALSSGSLGGAALDVYAQEPLPEDSPLREAPNLVLTPHLGASTAEAQERVAEEISEAVRAALAEGDLSRALNAPSVGGDVIRHMASLLDLSCRLGRLAFALTDGAPRSVEVGYAGAEDGIRLLPRYVLMGLLSPVVGSDGINVVNAAVLAEARGMTVSTKRVPRRSDFADVVEVTVGSQGGEVTLAGALLGDHHPRLVRIDDFAVSVAPAGTLLLLRNRDVPGVVGEVGSVLGTFGVNIAEYHQARTAAGGGALAAIVVDGPASPELVDRLRAVPDVVDARAVALD